MERIQASQIISDFVSNPKQPSGYFTSSPVLCHNLIITSHTKTHKSYEHCISLKIGRNREAIFPLSSHHGPGIILIQGNALF